LFIGLIIAPELKNPIAGDVVMEENMHSKVVDWGMG